jgi:hypothetical protein
LQAGGWSLTQRCGSRAQPPCNAANGRIRASPEPWRSRLMAPHGTGYGAQCPGQPRGDSGPFLFSREDGVGAQTFTGFPDDRFGDPQRRVRRADRLRDGSIAPLSRGFRSTVRQARCHPGLGESASEAKILHRQESAMAGFGRHRFGAVKTVAFDRSDPYGNEVAQGTVRTRVAADRVGAPIAPAASPLASRRRRKARPAARIVF